MNHIFSVGFYAGQQLMLTALQRWLLRPPCEEQGPAARARERASLRSLLVLLIRTTATGVVATVLDAAIEYRRRQLASSELDDETEALPREQAPSRFGPLGALSRAGIAAWKVRLLAAIDDAERAALQYGLPITQSPNRGGGASGTGRGSRDGSSKDGQVEPTLAPAGWIETRLEALAGARRERLSRTVSQLQAVVARDRGQAGEAHLERGIDSLLDELLGEVGPEEAAGRVVAADVSTTASREDLAGPAPRGPGGVAPAASTAPAALPAASVPPPPARRLFAAPSSLVTAGAMYAFRRVRRLGGLAADEGPSSSASSDDVSTAPHQPVPGSTSAAAPAEGLAISSVAPFSIPSRTPSCAGIEGALTPDQADPTTPRGLRRARPPPLALARRGSSDSLEASTCAICMDRELSVEVTGCAHALCFQCARRLCSATDHTIPTCPFCRSHIDGFKRHERGRLPLSALSAA